MVTRGLVPPPSTKTWSHWPPYPRHALHKWCDILLNSKKQWIKLKAVTGNQKWDMCVSSITLHQNMPLRDNSIFIGRSCWQKFHFFLKGGFRARTVPFFRLYQVYCRTAWHSLEPLNGRGRPLAAKHLYTSRFVCVALSGRRFSHFFFTCRNALTDRFRLLFERYFSNRIIITLAGV